MNPSAEEVEQALERVAVPGSGTGHRGPKTTPSAGKGAKAISPDRPVWEQQVGESHKAYAGFLNFRDSEDREVGSGSPSKWSSEWSWGYRAFEWDLYLARKADEDAVRWRREMNDRQRRAARRMQDKIVIWILELDVDSLSPSEAARWFETAVKVERLACGDVSERFAMQGDGQIGQMSAEEVREALTGLRAEIERLTGADVET